MERIHETLKIYKISPGELTAAEVAEITQGWGDGIPLNNFTIAFIGDRLLLNEDHDSYDFIEMLVIKYISADEDKKRTIRCNVKTRTAKSALHVLRGFLACVEMQHDLDIVEQFPPYSVEANKAHQAIVRATGYGDAAIIYAYLLGVIHGKRAERARRKAKGRK